MQPAEIRSHNGRSSIKRGILHHEGGREGESKDPFCFSLDRKSTDCFYAICITKKLVLKCITKKLVLKTQERLPHFPI
jgi:hypothetical protein